MVAVATLDELGGRRIHVIDLLRRGAAIVSNYTHASSYTAAIGRIDQEDVGKLALRIALGVLVLFHGVAKLTGGIDFITDVVVKAGLPSFVAYGVYVGEVVAPLMVIAGWRTLIGAAVIALNMLFAIGLVHVSETNPSPSRSPSSAR